VIAARLVGAARSQEAGAVKAVEVGVEEELAVCAATARPVATCLRLGELAALAVLRPEAQRLRAHGLASRFGGER